MRVLWVFVTIAALHGCSSRYPDDDRNQELLKALREGRNPFPTSTLVAYQIQHGIQRDDSVYISRDNLSYVGKMVSCPQVSIKDNPYTYQAEAKIDRKDMTVKVEANRAECKIDQAAAKSYLDNAIEMNRRKAGEQYEREQRQREVDPKGPYKLGCEAYQQHVKGWSDVSTIDAAIKLYPKLNSAYVKNLFITGWRDASFYGARGVDCEYLSLGVRG